MPLGERRVSFTAARTAHRCTRRRNPTRVAVSSERQRGPSGGRPPPHVELSQRVEEVVIGLEDLPLASPCLLGRLALSSLPLRRPEPRLASVNRGQWP